MLLCVVLVVAVYTCFEFVIVSVRCCVDVCVVCDVYDCDSGCACDTVC